MTSIAADPRPIIITHSDIAMFLACRRKWAWSYVQDFQKPERLIGPLAIGSRVHEAVEMFYRDGVDQVEAHEELAKKALAEAEESGLRFMDDLYEDIIVGRNCCKSHREWLEETGADEQFEVVAVEKKMEGLILDGRVMLQGKADVLFHDLIGGGLVVDDLKTASSWQGGLRERLERSYQHHVYLVLAELSGVLEKELGDGSFVQGAQYTVITKHKSPAKAGPDAVQRFRAPATRRMAKIKLKQIEQICSEMIRVMEEIELEGTSSLAYPTPAQECRWCDFKHPCEIADESPLASRAMLDADFVRGNRHKRYTPTTVQSAQ